MRTTSLYEPDLLVSALQAVLLMIFFITPLLWSLNFRRTIIPVSLSVPVISASLPVVPSQTSKIAEVQQELSAVKERLQQAEIARRKQATKDRREEEFRQREEERQQRIAEEQERQQREEELKAETKRQREEELKAEAKRQHEEELKAEAKRQHEEELKAEAKRQREEELKAEAKRQREEELKEQQLAAQAANQTRRDANAAIENLLHQQQLNNLLAIYIQRIRAQVSRYTSNPEGVPQDIKVVARVLLNRDGTLASMPTIVESSGNAAYDDQAMRAIIRAGQDGFPIPTEPELQSEFDELLLSISPREGS